MNMRRDIKGSDHAALTVTLETEGLTKVSPVKLLQRASALDINIEGFVNAQEEITPPDIVQQGEAVGVELAIAEGSRTIMNTAATFTPQPETQHEWNETQPR
ncbi:hypothetical protein E2C01_037458 [Portunus trituberculatus]|uniref:Uncharacterized protein n=1 Tax=Portunus trituberculatus TaxID=210409 RepID=A0A5B7FH53_PORTR|nr:hypothetical protein [Portunus trituberculatus]